MNNYLRDVMSQPESLKKAIDYFEEGANAREFERLKKETFSTVIFSGMGSSNFCAVSASQYLNQNGIVSLVRSTGQFCHFERGIIGENTLLVLISQSGESAEIVKLISLLPEGCRVVAVTNDPNSTLAKRGDYCFLMNVEQEESVTTRTYLASILIVNRIAAALLGHKMPNDRQAAQALSYYLENWEEQSRQMASFFQEPAYLALIGRGGSLASISAGALFLREIVKYPGIEFDAGEFRHGPMEMVEDGFNGIVFAMEPKTNSLCHKLALDIAERGGRVMLICDKPSGLVHSRLLEIVVGVVEEKLSPVVSIAPVQLFANLLAEKKGLDVGVFRWGAKITRNE